MKLNAQTPVSLSYGPEAPFSVDASCSCELSFALNEQGPIGDQSAAGPSCKARLDPDTLQFSRSRTTSKPEGSSIAIKCNYDALADYHPILSGLIRESLAPATRRAYASDLAHFLAWGGTIPALPRSVALYLAHHGEALSVATLARRISSISKAHAAIGAPSPTDSQVVRATLQGIRRRRGSAQTQAKPLLRDDLIIVLDAIGQRTKDARDRALLLLGFAAGFRRSELVGLDLADIEHVRQGVVLHLRRSKTDQLGEGRKIGIPHGRFRHCPVNALEAWLHRAAITTGPIFRVVNRHSHVLDQRLSGEAVSMVIAKRAKAAGIDPAGYSGHSLRAGFATSAAAAGVSSWKIRAQTGHASDAMLGRYIRDGQMFVGNATAQLL